MVRCKRACSVKAVRCTVKKKTLDSYAFKWLQTILNRNCCNTEGTMECYFCARFWLQLSDLNYIEWPAKSSKSYSHLVYLIKKLACNAASSCTNGSTLNTQAISQFTGWLEGTEVQSMVPAGIKGHGMVPACIGFVQRFSSAGCGCEWSLIYKSSKTITS